MAKRLDNKVSPTPIAAPTVTNRSPENSVEDDQSSTANSVEDDQSSIQKTSNEEGKRKNN